MIYEKTKFTVEKLLKMSFFCPNWVIKFYQSEKIILKKKGFCCNCNVLI